MENNMTMAEFSGKVRDAVKKKLGEAYKVEIRRIQKNNGVILHGLLILTDSLNVAPTLYLEPFWEAYASGEGFDGIVENLIAIYRKDMPKESIDMGFFQSFERVGDRICYRLIRQAGNKDLLEDIPHIPFLDLAVCFFYAYSGEVLGEGTILIRNSHLKLWHTNIEKLTELARKNTPDLFPIRCSSMEQVLRELMSENTCKEVKESGDLSEEACHMWVLSNRQQNHGAACMLYPEVLRKLAKQEGCSLYILPSSVHEVILLADNKTGSGTPGQLRDMIAEINRTQVAPEEVLSDSLYYYNYEEEKISILV